MRIITSDNYVIESGFFEVQSQSQIRRDSDTGTAEFYLLRSRAGHADVQTNDVLGAVVFNGVYSSTDQQFGIINTYFTGVGGAMTFKVATDAASNLVEGMIIDGEAYVINAFFDIFYDAGFHIRRFPASDSYLGWFTNQVYGETIAVGDVLYVDSDGKAYKADATDNTKSPALFLAIDAGVLDDNPRVLQIGLMDFTTLSPSWTPGGLVYLAVGGGFTQTPPSSAGNVVQIVGIAKTSKVLYFCPQTVMVEVGDTYPSGVEMKLATVIGIDAKTVAITDLYTAPVGTTVIIEKFVIRPTAFTFGSKTTDATLSIGRDSPNYDEMVGSNSIPAFIQSDQFAALTTDDGLESMLTAGQTVKMNITAGSDATVETWAVDIFGYFV